MDTGQEASVQYLKAAVVSAVPTVANDPDKVSRDEQTPLAARLEYG